MLPRFSPSKTVADYTIIDLDRPLGQGNFGTVYKAYLTNDPKIMSAVKTAPLFKLKYNKSLRETFSREISILKQIKGDHVVGLLGIEYTENNLYIFTEYCDGGTLQDKLKKCKTLSEEEACSIVRQIAKAFVVLESQNLVSQSGQKLTIMHRDIKPANILFHKGILKVADFGFAKMIDEVHKESKQRHTICGTPMYESPQIINEERYSAKCDVYSTGVVFYELLFGCLPWHGNSVFQIYDNIRKKPLQFPKPVSFETEDLLIRMLAFREEDRINWKEVYSHLALQPKDQIIENNIFKEPLEEKKEVFTEFNILQRRKTPVIHNNVILPVPQIKNVYNDAQRDKTPPRQVIRVPLNMQRDRTPPKIFEKIQPNVKKEVFKVQEYNIHMPVQFRKRNY